MQQYNKFIQTIQDKETKIAALEAEKATITKANATLAREGHQYRAASIRDANENTRLKEALKTKERAAAADKEAAAADKEAAVIETRHKHMQTNQAQAAVIQELQRQRGHLRAALDAKDDKVYSQAELDQQLEQCHKKWKHREAEILEAACFMSRALNRWRIFSQRRKAGAEKAFLERTINELTDKIADNDAMIRLVSLGNARQQRGSPSSSPSLPVSSSRRSKRKQSPEPISEPRGSKRHHHKPGRFSDDPEPELFRKGDKVEMKVALSNAFPKDEHAWQDADGKWWFPGIVVKELQVDSKVHIEFLDGDIKTKDAEMLDIATLRKVVDGSPGARLLEN